MHSKAYSLKDSEKRLPSLIRLIPQTFFSSHLCQGNNTKQQQK